MPTGAQLIIGAVIFPIGSALLLSLLPERSDKARNSAAVFIAAVTAAMVVMLLAEVDVYKRQAWEILKANIMVALIVLNPKLPISPGLVITVSYTHLDVYKRQAKATAPLPRPV